MMNAYKPTTSVALPAAITFRQLHICQKDSLHWKQMPRIICNQWNQTNWNFEDRKRTTWRKTELEILLLSLHQGIRILIFNF